MDNRVHDEKLLQCVICGEKALYYGLKYCSNHSGKEKEQFENLCVSEFK
jgi:hypothetical protein